MNGLGLIGFLLISFASASAEASCRPVWASGVQSHQSCQFQIRSTEGPSLVAISESLNLAADELLEIKWRLGSLSNLKGFEIRRSHQGQTDRHTFELHSDPNFSLLKSGGEQTLTLSNAHFQPAAPSGAAQIQIYLETKPNSVFEFEVLSVKKIKKARPGKGFVSITFDDGFASNFAAAQMMKDEGLPGTTYLIRSAMNQKGYLSKKQICQMGDWNWALSLHHETPLTDIRNLSDVFSRDQKWLRQLCPRGAETAHFAYPLGIHNFVIEKEMTTFFRSARSASGGLETLPPANPLALRTLNVTPSLSAMEILRRTDEALKSGDWLVLMFHRIKDKPEDDLDYPTNEFQKLVRGLKTRSHSVQTVPQVFEALSKP